MDLLLILVLVLLCCGSFGYGNLGGSARFGAGQGNVVGLILLVLVIVLVLRLAGIVL